MKKDIFSDIKDRIYKTVAEGRLREAFSLAHSISEGNMAWEISDALNEAEQSYRRLLSYAVSGADDPARDEMCSDLGETILAITDRLERDNNAKDTPTLYYNTLRYPGLNPSENIATKLEQYRKQCSERSLLDFVASGTHSKEYLTTTTERELLERTIFNLIWITFPLSAGDIEAISTVLKSGILPKYAVVLFTWAIVLGGLEFYDQRRLELLCDLYDDSASESSAVALIGILLVMHRWRNRKFSRRLRDRFAAVRELPSWQFDLRTAYMELTRTRDTERITHKINDEIVAQMKNLYHNFDRKISLDGNIGAITPEELEENPEWKDILDQSGLTDRLKEMSELQEEGGDIMMGTFAHMKSDSFFNDIANWFIPFHSERSEFADNSGQQSIRTIAGMFENLKFLCDSDKYSLMMSLSHVPASHRDMALNQLNAQAEQFNAMQVGEMDLSTDNRKMQLRLQIQNLYRFFHLFRRKGEFSNPFAKGVNLATVPSLIDDVKDVELLTLIAEFYFSHSYWDEAYELFTIIDAISVPTAALYQKMGHSLMKLGKISQAIADFEKADMLDSQSAWTLTRMVRCYSLLGNYSSALSAGERLEELRPNQLTNTMAIGRAHLALGNYSQAVKAFYKAFFLDEKSGKAIRPLAWSLLMDKQFEQSRKYYERIISEFDPTPEDYLNMGHLSLATGNYAEAQNFYRISLLARPQPTGHTNPAPTANTESFIADMQTDSKSLIHLGIAPSLIPLITDAILYSL
jgi:tetratricopeptide (TPR) repeat protein